MMERYVTGRRIIDELLHGQVVIIIARWILVLAGLLLAMWNPASLAELRIEILVLLCVAVVNFYLHLHLVVQRHSDPLMVYGASAIDLAVVTLLIMVQGGYDSNLYIFYYPAVLGYALAFPRTLTAFYTGGAVVAYGLIGLGTSGSVADMQDVVVRLLMLAAVAACGTIYQRIETDRRENGSSFALPAARRADAQSYGATERGVS